MPCELCVGLKGTDAMQVQGVPGRCPVHAGVVVGQTGSVEIYFQTNCLFGSGAAVAQKMKPHITWCISVHWQIKSPFALLAPSSDRRSLRYHAPLPEIPNVPLFHSSPSRRVFWITTFLATITMVTNSTSFMNQLH